MVVQSFLSLPFPVGHHRRRGRPELRRVHDILVSGDTPAGMDRFEVLTRVDGLAGGGGSPNLGGSPQAEPSDPGWSA